MDNTPLMITSYPRAILHIDADAFFASVEEAMDPSLRGKPVVTGKERGIIACANYRAKAQGVQRGITLAEARALCPDLVVLPSDYEAYGLYSKRMFNIIRTFTPTVEEYSVDEVFADITGCRRIFRTSYEQIAMNIQAQIQSELGITVAVGLSTTKALAKLCSKFRKPAGFTAVPGRYIHLLLQRTPVEKVWGFGPSSVELLHKFGMQTAYDYVHREQAWAAKLFHKPGRELWCELRGHSVWKVDPEAKTTYATIIKSKTFTPATDDKTFVYAKLVRNVESAFMKARRYTLRPQVLAVVLRHDNFHHDGLEARLNRPTSSALEAMPLVQGLFERVFLAGARYRSTMIVLGKLENDTVEQFDFFEDRLKIERLRCATQAIDAINKKYGKHTVSSGTALDLDRKPPCQRDARPERLHTQKMPGENDRQRLRIPRMGIKV